MDGVIQKYKDLIQSERENSRNRKSSRHSEEPEQTSKLQDKPKRKTMEQSLGALETKPSDQKRHKQPEALGSAGWIGNQDRESTTSSQLSATPRRKAKEARPTDGEKGLLMQMVHKATKSILEVFKAPNVPEKARLSLVEQIITDLIGPTFDTMRDLEERLKAAHMHAVFRDACQTDSQETPKNQSISQTKLVAALEQRVQELSKEKGDLETQLIMCRKELEYVQENGRDNSHIKVSSSRDSQSILNDKLLEAHDCLIKSNNILREQLELKETEFKDQRKLWDSQLQQVMSLIDTTRGKPAPQPNMDEDLGRSSRTTLVHSQHNFLASSNSLYGSPRPRGHLNHLPPTPQVNSPGSK